MFSTTQGALTDITALGRRSLHPQRSCTLAATRLACMIDIGGSIDPAGFIDNEGTRYVI